MAKYAVKNRIANAARKFSKELGSPVNKSTVRIFIFAEMFVYWKMTEDVLFHWENMMKIWETIWSNCNLTVTLFQFKLSYLQQQEFENTMTRAFCSKLIYPKPGLNPLWMAWALHGAKGTKTARTIPGEFPELKNNFLKRIHTLIAEQHDIPDELVLNWYQTGVPIVLGVNGQWKNEA